MPKLTGRAYAFRRSRRLADPTPGTLFCQRRDARQLRLQQELLEPTALGGDQHRLSAIDGAQLAVNVVQMATHGARRERQIVGDLLVDLALGELLQDAQLALG
jgi:hypothetical protein